MAQILELKKNTTNKIPPGADKPLSEKIRDLQRAVEILNKMEQSYPLVKKNNG